MTRLACVAGCTVRGRHLDTCPDAGPDGTCEGCLPRPAATGLHVCEPDERSVRDALAQLPDLYDELGDPRTGQSSGGGSYGGSDGTAPLPLDDTRRRARSAIRACLATWCRILEDDRGITLPKSDTVPAMAHHVAVQAGALLASEHAEQLVADLVGWTEVDEHEEPDPTMDGEVVTVTTERRHLGCWAEARRLVYRGRNRRGVTVPCPSCADRVQLDPEADVIRCPCGEWGTLAWWRQRLAPNLDEPMHADDLVAWLLLEHRVRVTPKDLRNWAHRGRITRQGRDEQGRTLYDAVEVAAHVLAVRAESA